jgi:cytoskeleton protein RodZ
MVNQDSNESGNGLSTENLGDFLKQKRLEKNYSLEKLSQKTKISINVLKSLEANDYAHLPSAAYIKGFVANYVKILAIPKEEAFSKMEHTYHHVVGKPFPALNHTKQMKEAEKKEVETSTPHEVIENSNSIFDNTKSMLPVAIFVAVVLVFVGGYKLISSVVESEVTSKKTKDLGPKIESSSALGKLNEPQEDKKEAAPVEEKVATDAEAPKEEAALAEEPKVEEPKPEIRRNFPPVTFKKIRSKLFSVNTSAPENNDPYLLPENIRKQMNPELQNVYVAAIEGNTWLSYKIDNKPIESHIISQGGSLFLQGEVIRVFLGNVNVTRIFYNNYLIDTPSKSGVKSLVFPEESNSNYSLPLFPKANDDILYTSEEYMKRMKLEEEELEKKTN